MQVKYGNGKFAKVNGLTYLKDLANLTISRQSLESVPVLDNLTKLNNIDLQLNKISDISALSNVTSVKKLLLNDNKITNLYALRNLVNCAEINLSNNLFFDTSSNDGGLVNNLEILVNLNKTGLLRKLNISGCSNIQNLSPLQASDLSWESQVGF